VKNSIATALGATAIVVAAAGLQGCVAAAGAGAAVSTSSYNDRRTSGTMVDDELIEFRVLEAIGDDPDLQPVVHVNAISINGAVLLLGEVPEAAMRDQIGQLARQAPNVRMVHNELDVSAQSSMLERSNDSMLTGRVKSVLVTNDYSQGTRVKVVTNAGNVYLMGLVTRAEAHTATEIARNVGGVKRVVKVFEYTD